MGFGVIAISDSDVLHFNGTYEAAEYFNVQHWDISDAIEKNEPISKGIRYYYFDWELN